MLGIGTDILHVARIEQVLARQGERFVQRILTAREREEYAASRLAHRLLGAVYARQGNFKEASPLLRKAITLHPTHIGSYDHLYGVLLRLNRYEEALQVADQGIGAARAHLADVPDSQEARLHMAMLLARAGRQEEAREATKAARDFAPKDGYTAFHAAIVLAILGDLHDSLEALSTAASRGYCITSELARNVDLDVLRTLPDFQSLVA